MTQAKHNEASSNCAFALESLISKTATRVLTATEIAGFVHGLLVTGGDTNRRDAKNSNPRGNMADVVKTKQELVKVAEAAEALKVALKHMSGPAASVFADVDDLIRSAVTVAIISKAAIDAAGDLVEACVISPLILSPQEQLATTAAFTFLMLTGTEPTRRTQDGKAYGPFLDFLTEVFSVRGMSASPENSAKEALKAMEKTRAQSPSNLHS